MFRGASIQKRLIDLRVNKHVHLSPDLMIRQGAMVDKQGCTGMF